MSNKKIISYAILHALGAAVYIALVATFVINAEKLFGKQDGLFSAMAFLFLIVISVAIMGILIFVRPAIWYLNGSKKQAVYLLLYTVGILILIALAVFLVLAF